MAFQHSVDAEGVTLTVARETGVLRRLLGGGGPKDLEALSAKDRGLAFAIGDLRALAEGREGELRITSDGIRMSHRLAAALDAQAGKHLSLPPLTDLTLRTDAEGLIGDPGFRLSTLWLRGGVRKTPSRTGAFLRTDRGEQRLPLWLYEALEVAEAPMEPGDAAQWEALARFRRALEPGVAPAEDGAAARVSMTDFLSGLEVSLADGFSISPNAQDDDFDVLPFSRERLAELNEVAEADAELGGVDLIDFQRKLRQRGALHAYRLGPGRFMVVDRSAAPALEVMAEMQRAPRSERLEFMRNPGKRISDAIEARLEASGAFDGLDDAGREEKLEAVAGPVLVQTEEYMRFSARVTGVGIYEAPPIALVGEGGTTWLPEAFSEEVRQKLDIMPADELAHLVAAVEQAIASGEDSVTESGVHLPATNDVLQELKREQASRQEGVAPEEDAEPDSEPGEPERAGPAILITEDNFEDVHWRPEVSPRAQGIAVETPPSIRTPLRAHQQDSLRWQAEAWAAGLPGVLNADEQGLGKTLQTISFLVWLNDRAARGEATGGPVLIVAPTSLLENWQQEVAQHVEAPGLGRLIRLYGGGIGAVRKAGAKGLDIGAGEALLDLGDLGSAPGGASRPVWILTTYTTMTNYQHSLTQIPFAVAVFDEIQALKTPGALRACAARAINAGFRIGLTGTPIENATSDLWAIMDQLAPGSLSSLRAFREEYGAPQEGNMQRLHARVFGSGGLPPLALRRLKEEVAKDLPPKTRRLLPLKMPGLQEEAYDYAREKLGASRKGGALKVLHHIRSVSVHPDLSREAEDADFIALSARLTATFRILEQIRARGERALVFIEDRRMQHRFVELAKAAFGLSRIDLINGETPITSRQAIVNRFQQHLTKDGGFDLLVLGPRAAGTGLTLTAATHVIHLSRWWNPAVEEQCNDRVHRIGQTSPVQVHVPMAIHPGFRAQSFDCLLQTLMQRKRRLAGSALWPMGDTGEDAAFLQRSLEDEAAGAPGGDAIQSAIVAMFEREGRAAPAPDADGGYEFD